MKIATLLLLLCITVHAGSRTSADYTILTDTVSVGGQRTTSASYSTDASLGAAATTATILSSEGSSRTGYVGQLYEITGLVLGAPSPTFSEGASFSLRAWQTLDDATLLVVPAADVAWNILIGPLVGLTAGGIVTAGPVYQNTDAQVRGAHAGFTATLAFTVLDSIADNFGLYAGDNLDDQWQVQHFGISNPLAAPGVDADGDGQKNLFEYLAGLSPTDPSSRFVLRIAPVTDQPTQRQIIFGPLVGGRTYMVKAKASLTAPTWDDISASAPSDNGAERTVTDLNATGGAKFYHIEITKP